MDEKVALERADSQAGIIRIDEQQVKDHLGEVVRETVEETLNGLLEAEVQELCRAARYEKTAERKDTRAGHYEHPDRNSYLRLNLPYFHLSRRRTRLSIYPISRFERLPHYFFQFLSSPPCRFISILLPPDHRHLADPYHLGQVCLSQTLL